MDKLVLLASQVVQVPWHNLTSVTPYYSFQSSNNFVGENVNTLFWANPLAKHFLAPRTLGAAVALRALAWIGCFLARRNRVVHSGH
jgi:hypothetical protein